MKVALVSLVKTPGLTPVKTRLAQSIGTPQATLIYEECLTITTQFLKKTQSINDNISVYWAVSEHEAMDDSRWSAFQTIWQGTGDLGHRLNHIYHQLIQTYDAVILIGSDSIDLTSDLIQTSYTILSKVDYVVGPAYDGGFYLFGCKHPIPQEIWTAVSYSKSDTLSQLEDRLSPLHFTTHTLPPLQDIDTFKDLSNYPDLLNLITH